MSVFPYVQPLVVEVKDGVLSVEQSFVLVTFHGENRTAATLK